MQFKPACSILSVNALLSFQLIDRLKQEFSLIKLWSSSLNIFQVYVLIIREGCCSLLNNFLVISIIIEEWSKFNQNIVDLNSEI